MKRCRRGDFTRSVSCKRPDLCGESVASRPWPQVVARHSFITEVTLFFLNWQEELMKGKSHESQIPALRRMGRVSQLLATRHAGSGLLINKPNCRSECPTRKRPAPAGLQDPLLDHPQHTISTGNTQCKTAVLKWYRTLPCSPCTSPGLGGASDRRAKIGGSEPTKCDRATGLNVEY